MMSCAPSQYCPEPGPGLIYSTSIDAENINDLSQSDTEVVEEKLIYYESHKRDSQSLYSPPNYSSSFHSNDDSRTFSEGTSIKQVATSIKVSPKEILSESTAAASESFMATDYSSSFESEDEKEVRYGAENPGNMKGDHRAENNGESSSYTYTSLESCTESPSTVSRATYNSSVLLNSSKAELSSSNLDAGAEEASHRSQGASESPLSYESDFSGINSEVLKSNSDFPSIKTTVNDIELRAKEEFAHSALQRIRNTSDSPLIVQQIEPNKLQKPCKHQKRFIVKTLDRLRERSGSDTSLDKDQEVPNPFSYRSRSDRQLHNFSRLPHCFATRADALKLENLFHRLKQKSHEMDAEMEDQTLYNWTAETKAAERQFSLLHRVRLQRNVLEDKLFDHALKMNSISLIGEIANVLPKPTASKEEIWQRFMNTAKSAIV